MVVGAAGVRLVTAVLPQARSLARHAAKLDQAASHGQDGHDGDGLSWYLSLVGAAFVGFGLAYVMQKMDYRRVLFCVDQYVSRTAMKLRSLFDRSSWKQKPLLAASSSSVTGSSRSIKEKKRGARDSAAFSYVKQGNDRMSVELCLGCVETNRLLRKIAKDSGTSYDTFEPCNLCRERVARLASMKQT
mmetsp:Transcript_5083/g.18264  ORF Transcript_5083/g.18264 Transcript_5083/m.18264 type:complete len:188 (-) Transcript_5083:99-662(-)